MKTLGSIIMAFLLLVPMAANSADADTKDQSSGDDQISLYWFYKTTSEKPIDNNYSVLHQEHMSLCQDKVSEKFGDDEDKSKQDAKAKMFMGCMKDKGWQYVEPTDMEDGYYVIELCLFKQGKMIEAPFSVCSTSGAMPFTMSYSTSFTPEDALGDAKGRYDRLQGK